MRHLSPSLAISVVALFFAIGGGAFAGGILVGSAQIRDHSIQLRDLSPEVIQTLGNAQVASDIEDTRIALDSARTDIANLGTNLAGEDDRLKCVYALSSDADAALAQTISFLAGLHGLAPLGPLPRADDHGGCARAGIPRPSAP